MDKNMRQMRAKLHNGGYSGLPAATPKPAPATRQAPVTMSAAERQSRENTAALFQRWDSMRALAAEFGEPDGNVAIEFAQRAVEPAEARRQFAARAADRQWAKGLSEAQRTH